MIKEDVNVLKKESDQIIRMCLSEALQSRGSYPPTLIFKEIYIFSCHYRKFLLTNPDFQLFTFQVIPALQTQRVHSWLHFTVYAVSPWVKQFTHYYFEGTFTPSWSLFTQDDIHKSLLGTSFSLFYSANCGLILMLISIYILMLHSFHSEFSFVLFF